MLEKDPGEVTRLFGTSDSQVQFVTGNRLFDEVEEANARGDMAEVERLLDRWESGGRAPDMKRIDATGEEAVFEDRYNEAE